MAEWQSVPGPLDNNTRKFLDFLGKAEGADYNTVVGGGTFDAYDAHPNVVGLRTKEGPSTAAGKYQITNTTYNDIAPKLGITDFSPESQDRIALELIKRGGAAEDVQKGDYNAAISKLGKTWASLPSSPYSQPKKSQAWVEKALDLVVSPAHADTNTNDGWAPVAAPVENKATDGWSAVGGSDGWAPVGATKQAPKRTYQEEMARQAGLAGRSILQGAERAFTYPVRAVGEAVGSGAEMLGAKDVGGWIRQNLGMGSNAGAQVASALDLPKPESKLEKLQGGAMETLSGFGVGGLMSKVPGAINATVAELTAADKVAKAGGSSQDVFKAMVAAKPVPTGAPTTAQQILASTMPAPTSAASTAIQSAVGGAMEVAPVETAAALALVTAGKAGYDKRQLNSAIDTIIKNAGNSTVAKTDAEVIKRMGEVADDPLRFFKGKAPETLSAQTINQAVTKSFLDPVKKVLDSIPKGSRPDNLKELKGALQNWNKLTEAERLALRGTGYGDAVSDAIEKAVRSNALTAAQPAKGGVLGTITRTAVNAVSPAISAMTGTPIVISSDLTKGVANKLGGRLSREDVSRQLLSTKNREAANELLNRFGPSSYASSLESAQGLADKAKLATSARLAAQQAEKVKGIADRLSTRNQVLQQSRMPLGGGFQELLPGGASGLNLTSADAIKALRVVSKTDKTSPVSQAAREILQSGNVKDPNAFYGVQNTIRRLSEEGKIAGGQLPQGVLSSGVRNPTSYAANVRTAEEAAKLARESAPSKSLGQFATTVAGTKSPSEKLKLVESRLARATDPAEIDYLNNFVRPLTNFGKK